MTMIIDGTNGLTFNNSTVQASAGVVLQVVSTTKSDTFSMTGQTYTSVTGLSASITPKFSTSKIFIIVSMTCGISIDATIATRLTRNGSAIDVGDAAGSRTPATTGSYTGSTNSIYNILPQNMAYLDSPATTSSTTYGVQLRSESTSMTVYVNKDGQDADTQSRSRYSSTITVMEIAG